MVTVHCKEILGHQKFCHLIQRMIVDFMKQNEEVFNAYIFGESFKAHRQQMEILVSGAL